VKCRPALVDGYMMTSRRLKLKLICDQRSVGQCVLVSGSCLEPMTRSLFSVLTFVGFFRVVSSLYNLDADQKLGTGHDS
jgi:hypothetical protein